MDDDEVSTPTLGFDKMRAMLARASDVRADEQRQLLDMLEEVRSRLGPIEGFVEDGRGRIGATHDGVTSIQERLGQLPDRAAVSVIAERLDEALARIDSQDAVLADMVGKLGELTDRIGRPLDALDARLEGVSGRFEGVAGRLDGLDDRLQHLHARLDELDASVGRVHGAVSELPAQLDPGSVQRRFDELTDSMQQRFNDDLGRVHGRLEDLVSRPSVDPTERLETLNGKLDQLAERIDSTSGRVKSVEESVRSNTGALSGSIEQGIDKLRGLVSERPDRDELSRTVLRAERESELRITQQLDGALADFAEVMIGQTVIPKPPPARAARKAAKRAQDEEE